MTVPLLECPGGGCAGRRPGWLPGLCLQHLDGQWRSYREERVGVELWQGGDEQLQLGRDVAGAATSSVVTRCVI